VPEEFDLGEPTRQQLTQEVSGESPAEPTALIGDSRSPSEIMVRWDGVQGTLRASKLTAIVENTTDRAIDVELAAVVSSRTGDQGELGVQRALAHGQSQSKAEVDLTALPVQTAGVSCSVYLVARWMRIGPTSTDPNEQPNPEATQNVSDTIHVTWDAGQDFREAVVRSYNDQRQEDDRISRSGTGRKALEEMRVRGARGTMSKLGADELASRPMGWSGTARAGDPHTPTQSPPDSENSQPEAEGS
jgi:hypothetical protein